MYVIIARGKVVTVRRAAEGRHFSRAIIGF